MKMIPKVLTIIGVAALSNFASATDLEHSYTAYREAFKSQNESQIEEKLEKLEATCTEKCTANGCQDKALAKQCLQYCSKEPECLKAQKIPVSLKGYTDYLKTLNIQETDDNGIPVSPMPTIKAVEAKESGKDANCSLNTPQRVIVEIVVNNPGAASNAPQHSVVQEEEPVSISPASKKAASPKKSPVLQRSPSKEVPSKQESLSPASQTPTPSEQEVCTPIMMRNGDC